MNLIKRSQNQCQPFKLFSDLEFDLSPFFERPFSESGLSKSFDPDIDVREEKDKYVVRVDLPGVRKEDFGVRVDGRRLTLKGTRNEEKNEEYKGYRYSERFYGSFSRSIQLPLEIQANKVKATYRDGVLEVN